jgi:hypothetical protein
MSRQREPRRLLSQSGSVAPIYTVKRLSTTERAFLFLSFSAFLASYFWLSFHVITRDPLWQDEVMSVWAARLAGPAQINAAFRHGAQAATPVFSLLLHYYCRLAGDSTLVLRLPSIAAAVVAVGCGFVLLRRHLGVHAAAFGCCLMVETLSPFAMQVRPYAIMTACLSGVLLLWDDLALRSSRMRTALVGVLLVVATTFHFYSVLFILCLAVVEFMRTIQVREWRKGLWLTLFAAGAAVFVWLPMMKTIVRFTAKDVVSSAHYALAPTLDHLIATYSYLFQGVADNPHLGGLGLNGVIVLSVVLLMGLCAVMKSFAKPAREDASGVGTSAAGERTAAAVNPVDQSGSFGASASRRRRDDFWGLVLCSLMFPFVVFLFSAISSRTYHVRYVIPGFFGAAAVLTEVISGFPLFRRLVPVSILIATGWMFLLGVPAIPIFDHSAIYDALPGADPIVMADGSQFFQLEESAPIQFRSRLVYLLVPSGVPVGDSVNEHAILRWKTIRPDLPVENSAEFLLKHRKFYVLDERTADDSPVRYVSSLGLVDSWKTIHGAVIYRSRPESAWEPDARVTRRNEPSTWLSAWSRKGNHR